MYFRLINKNLIQKISIFIIILILFLSLNVQIFSQEGIEAVILDQLTSEEESSSNDNQSSASSNISDSNISQQTQKIQEKQTSIEEVEAIITSLQKEIEDLNQEIANQEAVLKGSRERLNQARQNLENFNNQLEANNAQLKTNINNEQKLNLKNTNQNLTENANQESNLIEELNNEINSIQTEIAEKKSELIIKQQKLQNNQENLIIIKKEVQERLNSLQKQVVTESIQWTLYLSLVVAYWLVWRIAKFLVHKFIKRQAFRKLIRLILNFIWFIATLITIAYALVGRFQIVEQIITILAFTSLAISLALKDFISNFFGFVLLTLNKQYMVGEVISFNTGHGTKIGEVVKIGFFVTSIKELTRDQYPTGETVSIPNSLILTNSISNLTKTNKYIWTYFSLIVSKKSDLDLAKQKLEIILDKNIYKPSHKNIHSGSSLDLPLSPKVFLTSHQEGPAFKIYIPTKVGYLSEIREKIIKEIYNLNNKKIEIIKLLVD